MWWSCSSIIAHRLCLLELFEKCCQNLYCLTMSQKSESRIARHITDLQAQRRLAGIFKREVIFSSPAWMLVDKTLHDRVREQKLITPHATPSPTSTIHPEPERFPVG